MLLKTAIMPAFCSVILNTYYAQNIAGIKFASLGLASACFTSHPSPSAKKQDSQGTGGASDNLEVYGHGYSLMRERLQRAEEVSVASSAPVCVWAELLTVCGRSC